MPSKKSNKVTASKGESSKANEVQALEAVSKSQARRMRKRTANSSTDPAPSSRTRASETQTPKMRKSNLTADATIDPTTTSTIEPFRFLDLPGELRNEIVFKWLFPTPERPTYFYIGVGEYHPAELDDMPLTLGIYRVCKQIY